MIACSVGNGAVVRALLSAGASTSSEDSGDTPVRRATAKGHREIVRLLCDAGAELNAASSQQTMPVIVAAAGGQVGVVRLLCKAGADPNVVDSFSRISALRYAVGHAAVVRELLRAGANVNEGEKETSALYLACSAGYLDVVRELVRGGANPVVDANYAMTVLHLAADRMKLKLAYVLLEEGSLEMAEDTRG